MADQPDHIPEGYISVQDAFEDHHTKKFGFAPNFNLEGVVTDEFEAVQNELLTAFKSGHLQVLYRQPKRTENATRPAREWKEEQYPEQVFYHSPLPDSHALRGRTLFIEQRQFQNWSLSAISKWAQGTTRDPMTSQDWTLGEALAWLVWMDTTAIQIFQHDDGLINGFYRVLKRFEITSDLPAHRTVDTAFSELKKKCSAGELNATGLSEPEDGDLRPAVITPTEWRYLEPFEPYGIHFGKLDALQIAGSADPKFWDVRFSRKDILASFSPDANASPLPSIRNPPEAVAKAMLEEHISLWRSRDMDNQHKISRDDFVKEGQQKHPGTSSRYWRTIWQNNRPTEWGKSGPTGPRKG